jgi:hypothetical protein
MVKATVSTAWKVPFAAPFSLAIVAKHPHHRAPVRWLIIAIAAKENELNANLQL